MKKELVILVLVILLVGFISASSCEDFDGKRRSLRSYVRGWQETITDECEDENNLLEAICEEGVEKQVSLKCLHGCYKGTCRPEVFESSQIIVGQTGGSVFKGYYETFEKCSYITGENCNSYNGDYINSGESEVRIEQYPFSDAGYRVLEGVNEVYKGFKEKEFEGKKYYVLDQGARQFYFWTYLEDDGDLTTVRIKQTPGVILEEDNFFKNLFKVYMDKYPSNLDKEGPEFSIRKKGEEINVLESEVAFVEESEEEKDCFFTTGKCSTEVKKYEWYFGDIELLIQDKKASDEEILEDYMENINDTIEAEGDPKDVLQGYLHASLEEGFSIFWHSNNKLLSIKINNYSFSDPEDSAIGSMIMEDFLYGNEQGIFKTKYPAEPFIEGCVDTDGGKNYYKAGIVWDSEGYSRDQCNLDTGFIRESYCDEGQARSSQDYCGECKNWGECLDPGFFARIKYWFINLVSND